MYATISADIIASTSLSENCLQSVNGEIKNFFSFIESIYNSNGQMCFWGRLVKGDTVECFIREPHNALRIALMLKAKILTIHTKWNIDVREYKNPHIRLFFKYGTRIAIGVGDLRLINKDLDIIDGEAIYLSGRKIQESSTSGKQKPIVKNSIFFVSSNHKFDAEIGAYLNIVDYLFKNASVRQIEIISHKLNSLTDIEVAKKMHLSVSTVNQHCSSFGWNVLSAILNRYESDLFPL